MFDIMPELDFHCKGAHLETKMLSRGTAIFQITLTSCELNSPVFGNRRYFSESRR